MPDDELKRVAVMLYTPIDLTQSYPVQKLNGFALQMQNAEKRSNTTIFFVERCLKGNDVMKDVKIQYGF
jgi:hypothetical protein